MIDTQNDIPDVIKILPAKFPVIVNNSVKAQRHPLILQAANCTTSFFRSFPDADTFLCFSLPLLCFNQPPKAFVLAISSFERISSSTAGRQLSHTGGYRAWSEIL